MKKFFLLLTTTLCIFPLFAYATSACTNKEIFLVNNSGQNIYIDSIIPDKGNLDIKTGNVGNGETVKGIMDKTVEGTSKGYIVIQFSNSTLYYIKYDYHAQKSYPLNCIKSINAEGTGSAASKYEHALQGDERSGDSRTIFLFQKRQGS